MKRLITIERGLFYTTNIIYRLQIKAGNKYICGVEVTEVSEQELKTAEHWGP